MNESSAVLHAPWTLYGAKQRWMFLTVLFLVSTSSYVDRQVITVILEQIKHEFGVSDTALGFLSGLSFALFYATLGIPVARLADRGNRQAIIGVSLVIWSAMTLVCGFTQSFAQLVVARVGVGIGEAGSMPPSQSLIADYFPPLERARALGVYLMSATAGYLVAFVFGAQLAASHGWRSVFLLMGLPGFAIAVLVALGLREPRMLLGRDALTERAESLSQSLRALANKPAFVNLTFALILYFMVAYGAIVFFPSYMIRVLRIRLTTVGTVYGTVSAVAALIGSLLGGVAIDRLASRDRRWLARGPAVLLLLCVPIYEFAFVQPTFGGFLTLTFLGEIGLTGAVTALFAFLHGICGSKRRALAVATIFFFANLFGTGAGPIVAGFLSDRFTALLGPLGIRFAIMLVVLLFLPASWLLLRAAKTIAIDSEA